MDTEHITMNYDSELHAILDFLFAFGSVKTKEAQRETVIEQFEALDLAANYVLFSIVRDRLPHRAKCLFSGEDFAGKRQIILDVLHAIPYTA